MRKTLFFPMLLMSYLVLNAQGIIIEAEDLPSPGISIPISDAADSSIALSEISPPGTGLTWDFSDLVSVSQSVDSFVSLNDVNPLYLFNFPDASVLKVLPEADTTLGLTFLDLEISDAFQFFSVEDTGYFDLGIGFETSLFSIPLGPRRDPPQLLLGLPLAFGDTDSSFSTLEIFVTQIPFFYYRQEQTLTYEVDAEGSLTTPLGTFETLRVKSDFIREDSIVIGDTTLILASPPRSLYQWWGKDGKVPLLEINTFELFSQEPSISRISYQDTLINVATSSRELISKEGKLYPNPAVDEVRLSFSSTILQRGELTISDIHGRIVIQYQLNGFDSLIPLHHLPSGIYAIKVKEGNEIYSGKLMISRD